MGDLFSAIAELFLIFDRWKFNKKKKERRQLEKDNNLPKKVMIYPLGILFGIIIAILIVTKVVHVIIYFNVSGN